MKSFSKSALSKVVTILLVMLFGLMAIGSTSSEPTTQEQGSGTVESGTADTTAIGKYKVDIKSCRLAKSYDDKDVVIVKYGFTNVSNDTAASFSSAIEDEVFQNGIGLNKAYVLSDDANFSTDNQSKEIKKGATLDVEVAYELNDSTTDINVEVSLWLSFDNTKFAKTFKIA